MAQPRIHVLGLGSIGLFAAHTLAESRPQPAITLLLHRGTLVNDYIRNGSCISLKSHTGETLRQNNYDLEVLRGDRWFHVRPTSRGEAGQDCSISDEKEARDHMRYLVVAVKAWQTTSALTPLKHRLDSRSTILFIQNGAGVIDALNQTLFQDSKTRPRYIMGVTRHCVNLLSPFNIEHTASSKTQLGIVPHDTATENIPHVQTHQHNGTDITSENPILSDNEGKDKDQTLLTSLLTQVPRFDATLNPYQTFLQVHLEKLTINAVVNPICALADAQNSHLWSETTLRNALCSEISAVATHLPELAGIPGVAKRFSPDSLEEVVLDNLRKTEKGTCSMVWDLRGKRKTEVRFINGYWVRRGKEVGIDTPINAELVRRIEEKEAEYL